MAKRMQSPKTKGKKLSFNKNSKKKNRNSVELDDFDKGGCKCLNLKL